MRKLLLIGLGVTVCTAIISACAVNSIKPVVSQTNIEPPMEGKPVIYQVFTRLFGNKKITNKPWGTIAENGVGKFADFSDTALTEIKALGVSHIWYTGVLHHGAINGFGDDDPDVVKGRAGSPYAIKDYYDVNPDLAIEPEQRLEEFSALIERSHQHGLKVIIDIVPNHVARAYHSNKKPQGIRDFGADDDKSVVYRADNNFYYVPGEDFKVPQADNGYLPLGGEPHPLADGKFYESPAKWTGNGSRKAQPDINDWYETVKVNFGVSPDGRHDFPELPAGYAHQSCQQHAAFWQDKKVPNTWGKFRDIAHYWLAKGVDGFRYDMAEMVPVAFWSYLNCSIKMVNPDAFLLAEVYNPALYRDYIQLGKMDQLYDKVDFYDTLKAILQGKAPAAALVPIQARNADIERHMLHFMENHDEHRIAAPAFLGDANKAKPGMVVSTTISRSATMVYFGQEVGEAGEGDPGFGDPGRTTIFDYWGVPAHQRWMNGGKFNGGELTAEEHALRDFYQRLLTFSSKSKALTGKYLELHSSNLKQASGYTNRHFSFARWSGFERVIVISNFSADKPAHFEFQLPKTLLAQWQLTDGSYEIKDQLYGATNKLEVLQGIGRIKVKLAPLESVIYRVK